MKAVQQGFTLIELMIVVAIIGILAAIAIPAYQDYTIRAQVTEGMNLASAVKAEVAEYYAQNGTWPTDLTGTTGTLGHAATEIPSGKYVKAVNIVATNGTITIEFEGPAAGNGFQANEKITGKILALRPVLSGNDDTANEDVVWVCGQHAAPTLTHDPTAGAASSDAAGLTTLDNKYLPATCRP
ncbi:MAG: pilin [Gammaproteobacteria bacterium]